MRQKGLDLLVRSVYKSLHTLVIVRYVCILYGLQSRSTAMHSVKTVVGEAREFFKDDSTPFSALNFNAKEKLLKIR